MSHLAETCEFKPSEKKIDLDILKTYEMRVDEINGKMVPTAMMGRNRLHLMA